MVSRDTTTGLRFEEKVKMKACGVDVSKGKLYIYLNNKGVNWEDYISRKLLPDEAYVDEENKKVIIYEKKFQKTEGSADEKPQTCGFKIWEFKKLFSSIGITDVSYIYIFNEWFKQAKYKDMLSYIKMVDGCDYIFAE